MIDASGHVDFFKQPPPALSAPASRRRTPRRDGGERSDSPDLQRSGDIRAAEAAYGREDVPAAGAERRAASRAEPTGDPQEARRINHAGKMLAERFIYRELDAVALPHTTFSTDAFGLIVRSSEGYLRRARNLCVGALLEAVRDRVRTIDLKQVNRVLLQPHWREREAS